MTICRHCRKCGENHAPPTGKKCQYRKDTDETTVGASKATGERDMAAELQLMRDEMQALREQITVDRGIMQSMVKSADKNNVEPVITSVVKTSTFSNTARSGKTNGADLGMDLSDAGLNTDNLDGFQDNSIQSVRETEQIEACDMQKDIDQILGHHAHDLAQQSAASDAQLIKSSKSVSFNEVNNNMHDGMSRVNRNDSGGASHDPSFAQQSASSAGQLTKSKKSVSFNEANNATHDVLPSVNRNDNSRAYYDPEFGRRGGYDRRNGFYDSYEDNSVHKQTMDGHHMAEDNSRRVDLDQNSHTGFGTLPGRRAGDGLPVFTQDVRARESTTSQDVHHRIPQMGAAAAVGAQRINSMNNALPTLSSLRDNERIEACVSRRLAEIGLDDEPGEYFSETQKTKRGKRSGISRTVEDQVLREIDWPHFYIYRGADRKPTLFNDLTLAEFNFGFLAMLDSPRSVFNKRGYAQFAERTHA